ncbi:uncharacterized protein NECHADRAFT_102700 [Fusarium vanettenii 77-13-4]|uniref:Uncharacterized protein n=1 Tax=Fusarium vanettenii (strain ATCC MYA-4622 / CBS 123669 / FGSC 9596 / NRRL 45880 / 77-13-4) TaxID=660122 RepID=C7ZKS0_FUSV7|nr:uncharacterized protein NECHADRAFT_102700 [Fusarium vanettenii 77-13-4]EEU35383.1 hypothetical protein NECHADRAFT_102700 [Fusarium vanettenii 77-13-4]
MVLIPLFLRVVSLTLLAATFTNAETGIVVPWNITAGQTEELTIRTRIDASDHEARKRFNAYRVYLALEPPGWGSGPVCWLAWSVPLDTDRVNITIPADVAPDKTRIRISASLYKRGQSHVNGYSYSSRTTLLGANGTWSQRELDGWDSSEENRISCWAYGCTRRCHMKYYTGDKTRYSDGSSEKDLDACIDQCLKDLDPRSAGSKSTSVTTTTCMLAAVVAVGVINLVI